MIRLSVKNFEHDYVIQRRLLQENLSNYKSATKGSAKDTERSLILNQLRDVDKKIKELKEKYGNDFSREEYGWAYAAIKNLNIANEKTILKCGLKKPCCESICCDNPSCKLL